MKDAAASKSPWRWILGALAVAAVAAALFAFRGSSQTTVPAARPARKDLVVSIASDGSLEPPPGGELRAAAPATVREIFVAEGQRVTRGSPLVRLD